MKCRDIIRILEKLAPREYACDWDNPGLLAGRGDKEVETVLTASMRKWLGLWRHF